MIEKEKILLEFAYSENNYLNDSIKTGDTKASILITINGVIIGLLINDFHSASTRIGGWESTRFLLIVGIITLLFSYWYTLRLVYPNLKNRNGEGIIFWEDIKKITMEEYRIKVRQTPSLLNEMIEQNYYLSKTTSRKYKLLKRSFMFSYIGYLPIMLFYIISIFL